MHPDRVGVPYSRSRAVNMCVCMARSRLYDAFGLAEYEAVEVFARWTGEPVRDEVGEATALSREASNSDTP